MPENIVLKQEQKEVLEILTKAGVKDVGNVLLQVRTGFGKSFIFILAPLLRDAVSILYKYKCIS